MSDPVAIRRALLSVSDKTGLVPLAERLALAGPRTSAQKRRRTKQRRVQKKAGGMDVD